MVTYLETGLQLPFPMVPCLESGGSNGSLYRNRLATSRSSGSIFRNWWLEWFPIQKLDCNPPSARFHIQKPFATIFRNVQESNPPFQQFHVQKVVFPMVHYLKTGLQLPFPTVPSIETVCNHIQKCLRRQPPAPTVPYLETSGSNDSLFRNCLQPPVPTETYQKLVVPMVS